MKIIDLLNKISNDEIPAKIKYKNTIYEFKNIGYETGYVNEYGCEKHWFTNCIDIDDKYKLNDEVEILDNEDEDIEEINKMAFVYHVEDEKQNANNDRFRDFINILIDEVNKLKKEGKWWLMMSYNLQKITNDAAVLV